MKNVDRRVISALTLAVALATMGEAQSTQTRSNNSASTRRDLDGVWAIRPATTTPRTAFECCLVDPRLRPPMTP
jgi:hypothetical protein